MPDVKIEKGITLDLLPANEPATSSTNDMPIIETQPDSIAAPESKEAPETEGTTTGESATPEKEATADSAATPETKKPAKGVQKRIDELTREREEAKRLAESEHAEKLRLLALLEKGGKQEQSTDVQTEDLPPVKPSKADYADPDAYDAAMDSFIEAKASWTAKQEVKAALDEQNRKTMEANIAAEQKAVQTQYMARVEKVMEKYPDFKEVAESPDVTVSIPMAHAIIHSEQGPDIAYYLGKHPEEAARISSLLPPLQLVELGIIAASLKTPASSPAAVKPIVSAAPKPIKPLGTGAGNIEKPIEEMSMEEYAAKRIPELNAQRRGLRH